MTEDVLEVIHEVVGDKGWIADPAGMASYLAEERGRYTGTANVVVRPASAMEVAEVVRLCARTGLEIVPQGGNTGLVGGSVARGGIVLSTERLTKVREVDTLNHTINVEAGVILADVQRAAEDAGAFFPLSLGAEGRCHIGGTIATNAGGTNVLHYGNVRDLVLGLEVVLPDGQVWDGMRSLRKDNTGYDLKQLFIGSEGTLGIITAAQLKLFPRPVSRETAFVACETVSAALSLFERVREDLGNTLTGVELVARRVLEFGTRHIPGVADPFSAPHPWYLLIELTSPRPDDDLRGGLEKCLGPAFEDGTATDAVLAESIAQGDALWAIREAIPEAQKHEGGSIKHDVAVPVSRVAEFVEKATKAVEGALPGVRVCPFGHMGDGNLHFNLSQPEGMETKAFLARWEEMNRIVHDIAVSMNGTFSAEHGIGMLKKDELAHYRSQVELDLMRTLKRALDPNNIMNPGKVVDS